MTMAREAECAADAGEYGCECSQRRAEARDHRADQHERQPGGDDGRGIIIGGLIQEADTDRQGKIPFVGDLWGIGRAFQRRVGVRDRTEIIVALVPRVVPYTGSRAADEELDLYRATTPLFDESLNRYQRPGEGQLPDAMKNPRKLRIKRVPDMFRNLNDDYPLPPEYYLPARSESGEYDPNVPYDPTTLPAWQGEEPTEPDHATYGTAAYDEPLPEPRR